MTNLTVINVTNPAGCYVCGRTAAEGHAPDCTFGKCLFCNRPLSEPHLPGCLVVVLSDGVESIAHETAAALTPIVQVVKDTAEAAMARMERFSIALPPLREALWRFQAEQKRQEKESRRHFDALVKALRKAGYRVKVNWVTELVLKRGRTVSCRMPNKAKIAQVRGKGIRAVFATVGSSVGIEGEITSAHPRFDGQLVAENARCFDKWSKAPMTIDLPRDPAEVIAWLRYLGSDEGYNISNGYLYLERNPFPNKHDQMVGKQPRPRLPEPIVLHGLGEGVLRARLLPRKEIDAALAQMDVKGGYAAATEMQLVQARLNAVLRWGQEETDESA